MALLGALFAAGILVSIAAVRGYDASRLRPPRTSAPNVGGSDRSERFSLRLALGVGIGVVVGVITQWPVAALLLGAAGFLLPSLLGGKAAREASIDRIEGIAMWAEMLRDTMAGAGGLEQSIIATAPISPPPVRTQVVRLAASLERQQLAPSLRAFADEIDDPAGDLVVAALLLAADKSPKKLGDLLGRLAHSARADVNMRLRVEASRARTRTAVRVIIIFTVLFSVFLLLFNRKYLDPYDTLVGQGVLSVVGMCFGGAFLWLSRSFRFADDERFLRTDQPAEVFGP
jgi:tight adherence protein B